MKVKSAIVASFRFSIKLVFIGQLLLNFIVQVKRCVMLTVFLENFWNPAMTCTLEQFDHKWIRSLTTCNQRTSRYRPAHTQLFSPTGKYFIVWKIIILVSSPFSVKEYAEWFEIRTIMFNRSNGTLSRGIENTFAGVGLDLTLLLTVTQV